MKSHTCVFLLDDLFKKLWNFLFSILDKLHQRGKPLTTNRAAEPGLGKLLQILNVMLSQTTNMEFSSAIETHHDVGRA
jgi:hypothetical protein